jgi:hypothetical protein
VFLFAPAIARRIAFVAASLVALISSWLVGGGPESPYHLITIAAFGIAAGALLIEFAALLRLMVKGRRTAHG